VQKITDIFSGIYVLEFFAPNPFKINHSKFCDIQFKSGFYFYIGSAQKNFNSRIIRHLKLKKKLHWHIDYLSTNENICLENVYMFNNVPNSFECKLTNRLQTAFDLIHIAKGFGNSDCNLCVSHLLYSRKKITHSQLLSLYQSIVRFIPSSREIF